jgi:hypothetical protein
VSNKTNTKYLLYFTHPYQTYNQIVTISLQVLTIDTDSNNQSKKLCFDPEWLAIVRSTNHLLCVERKDVHMPGPRYAGRWNFAATKDEIEEVVQILGGNLEIPENFQATQVNKSINPFILLICTMTKITVRARFYQYLWTLFHRIRNIP